MSPFHAFLRLLSLALCLAGAQPAFAQSSTTPPSGPIMAVDALPDLVISSMKGSAVCTPQGTITATIEATVKNQGKSTADLSKVTWQIILAGYWAATSDNNAKYLEKYPPPQTVTPYVGGPMKLAYNQTWTGTMTIAGITKYKSIKGITGGGPYVLSATADPNKHIAESNEKNNDKRVTVKDPCFKLVR
jgi:hypothetical protein